MRRAVEGGDSADECFFAARVNAALSELRGAKEAVNVCNRRAKCGNRASRRESDITPGITGHEEKDMSSETTSMSPVHRDVMPDIDQCIAIAERWMARHNRAERRAIKEKNNDERRNACGRWHAAWQIRESLVRLKRGKSA